MTYTLIVEPAFREDYQRVTRGHPHLKDELRGALELLREDGTLPPQYNPHVLDNPDGNYNGHVDFHLSDGEIDVIVIYVPHKSNPSIRLVRMGSHEELFRGPLL